MGWSPRRRAAAYRDGLLIAFLAYRPVRLKNLASMRFGRHLTKVGSRWHFADDETKSHILYAAAVPLTLAPRISGILDLHRAVLMRGEQGANIPGAPPLTPELDAVWVSEHGFQLKSDTLAGIIVERTGAAFGRSVSPHLFRDCAATSIAVDNPKHVGDLLSFSATRGTR